MSIAAIRPYSFIQPLNPTRSINSVKAIRTVEGINKKADFCEILQTEIKRINPSASVDKIQKSECIGSTGKIGYRNYSNKAMPMKMNKLASSFQNKTAFYSASGVLGAYKYTTCDMRI